ncbi:MAG TPA: glycosyltransferase [Christensenellaceae bacterium]|nr:glycosyltransferase [Christensenellaceae bacterium]
MPDMLGCVVLIPSLHPDEKLVNYVKSLTKNGFKHILVVDDGSGEDDIYQDIFRTIAQYDNCTVIGYEKNKGKGHALKYGMEYFLQHYPDSPGIITADSDGQHTSDGVIAVANKMLEKPDSLVLGSRNFRLGNTPLRSRIGNELTTFFYALLYGSHLPDTQTGLRGISRQLIPIVINIEGNRFEYEMNMLTECAMRKIPFSIVDIKTIYIEDNKSSHFNPVKDSIRIYRHLFGNFFKYIFSSLMSFLVDISVFTLLDRWLLDALFAGALGGRHATLHTYAAAAIARIISSITNFTLNKNFVFNKSNKDGAFPRYLTLCVLSLAASAISTDLIYRTLNIDKSIIKIVVDTLLYFVNYRVQKAWVFPLTKQGEKDV